MNKIKIEPTTLIDDLNGNNLNNYIKLALEQNVSGIHFDVIDGKYAPKKAMKISWAKSARIAFPNAYFSVHIMAIKPKKYLKQYLKIEPKVMFFQIEGTKNFAEAEKLINWATDKTQIGIAIDLQTPIDNNLISLINKSNVVLILPVKAGQSGQKMVETALEKVIKIKKQCKNIKEIYVDGGINAQNANKVISAGATTLCMGSYLYKLITTNNASNFVKSINQ